jgi:hypothetical protein
MRNIVALGAFAHFQPSECWAMDDAEFREFVDIVARELDNQTKDVG